MRTMQSMAIVFALTAAVVLPAQEMTDEEILRLPTYVIVLNDGEQLVIRGGYEVRDGLVVFYLDHGSHPVFSSVLEETVDFEATESANQWLRDEREREERFWRLVEERRRRMLEEVESRPVVITSQTGMTIQNEEEQQPGVTVEEAQQFPPYDQTRLSMEPEVWWRNESARLFAALDASNLRLAALQQRHDEIARRINKARSESEAAPHQRELLEVRQALLAEREKARLIGNRLTDLSIAAEELAKPLDWLLPTGSAVIDEAGAGFAGEPAGDMEIRSYDAAELADEPDAWWANERARLEGAQREARQRLVSLRERYNQLLAERNAEQSDIRIIQLNQQIEALDASISDQNARLQALDAAYSRLLEVARELGKEEALGLMRER